MSKMYELLKVSSGLLIYTVTTTKLQSMSATSTVVIANSLPRWGVDGHTRLFWTTKPLHLLAATLARRHTLSFDLLSFSNDILSQNAFHLAIEVYSFWRSHGVLCQKGLPFADRNGFFCRLNVFLSPFAFLFLKPVAHSGNALALVRQRRPQQARQRLQSAQQQKSALS